MNSLLPMVYTTQNICFYTKLFIKFTLSLTIPLFCIYIIYSISIQVYPFTLCIRYKRDKQNSGLVHIYTINLCFVSLTCWRNLLLVFMLYVYGCAICWKGSSIITVVYSLLLGQYYAKYIQVTKRQHRLCFVRQKRKALST